MVFFFFETGSCYITQAGLELSVLVLDDLKLKSSLITRTSLITFRADLSRFYSVCRTNCRRGKVVSKGHISSEVPPAIACWIERNVR